MKKHRALLFAILCMSSFAFSQNTEPTVKPTEKSSQTALYNDIYGGYGALSIFYFTGEMDNSFDMVQSTSLNDAQSAGTFYIAYQRSLNKVISTGFVFGYQNFHRTGTGYLKTSGASTSVSVNDNLLMGMARVTFCYLNKRVIRMYSGVGIGITVDLATINTQEGSDSDRKLLPGGQLTLMGLRFGRAFGGFIEFGFGTYGIVNAGLSYKFSD
jgi:hypothetical protein